MREERKQEKGGTVDGREERGDPHRVKERLVGSYGAGVGGKRKAGDRVERRRQQRRIGGRWEAL